jgi:hypothetical protein
MNGVIYTTTGERSRGQVASYHHKPSPLFLNKTKHVVDVAGLKKAEQRTAIKFEGQDIEAKFTIGFEVEKNQLHRGAVREYELFCGFERDGSCGYEAVTHVLPLLPSGQWRTKVYDMMHKAEKIIDDRYSPSDRRCGGHITIAVDGMSGDQLREAVRKNCGIIYALFKKRISNHYCSYNNRMQSYNECTNWHTKYQLALVKGGCLEFRVPSRFESVKQMMRRYELFYEIVNASVSGTSHEALLKKLKPVIVSMYNGDTAKADEVLRLAKLFRTYILKGEVHQDIAQYLTR